MKISNKLKKIKKEIESSSKKYDTEFDSFTTTDANNNKYYYFHFKPRHEQNNAFNDALKILKSNKIRYTVPLQSSWKSLIFVPHNQKLNYIVHSKDDINEILKYEILYGKK
jgi:hypothetical protein